MELLAELVIPTGLVLLPVIPAFVFFKFLPSTAIVRGPLKGWKVDLTGGFAGYFAVLILLLFVFVPDNELEVWRVKGRVLLESATDEPPIAARLGSHPRSQEITPDGFFTYAVIVPVTRTGVRDYPTISLAHDGFYPQSVQVTAAAGQRSSQDGSGLNHPAGFGSPSYRLSFDHASRVIEIVDPIILSPKE